MNNKSGGKALYSTINAYLEKGYNVYYITDKKNDYSLKNIRKKNIYYIDTTWYDKLSTKYHGIILHILTCNSINF